MTWWTNSAFADETDTTSEPAATAESEVALETASKIDVRVPDPGPPVQRQAYVHEGFYFRGGVGPGWQWSTFDDRGSLGVDADGDAFSMAVDLMVGGSPSPGIALGAGLLTNTGFSLTLEDDTGNEVGDTTNANFLIGPFFDAFPNEKGGWHLGAELGFALTTLEDLSPDFITNAYGLGAAAWVGHDWWVAPEWSAGLSLRMGGTFLWGSRGEADIRNSNLSTSLLVNVLYN